MNADAGVRGGFTLRLISSRTKDMIATLVSIRTLTGQVWRPPIMRIASLGIEGEVSKKCKIDYQVPWVR